MSGYFSSQDSSGLLFPRLGAPKPGFGLADAAPALECAGKTLSYRELAGACADHLAALSSRTIGQPPRVAISAVPSIDTVVALVAHACAGIASVPLNPKLGADSLRHILRDAQPSCVLVPRDHPALVEQVRAVSDVPTVPFPLPNSDSAKNSDSIKAAAPAEIGSPISDGARLILYTSGTTGPPKGVVLTEQNLRANLDALAHVWQWTEDDLLVHALPLFHVHGLVLGVFGCLRVGGSLRLVPKFDVNAIDSALVPPPSSSPTSSSPAGSSPANRRSATMFFGVPTMYRRLADAAEQSPRLRQGLGKMRLLVSGSAALPVSVQARIQELTGRGVHERYGLTETLILCAVPSWAPPEPGCVGPPLPGVDLRLRPLDGKNELGEILARGQQVSRGYLGGTDREPGAWFATGDLASQRPDGSVRIMGRQSTDLIKTGGFRVGAGEIEHCLLADPRIREVAVVGCSDDDLGQRIVAVVVPARPSPTASELEQRVAGHLAPHKRPREVIFVEELPRNAMGKINKVELVRKLERPT